MPRKHYSKPQLQQIDLSETPKAWVLLQEVIPLRYQEPYLLTAVLCLAHYAATLAQGMPTVLGNVPPDLAQRPPSDPERIDHGTDILGDRRGRLAGINVTCARALGLVRQRRYYAASEAVCEALDELGLDRPRCCVVQSAS